MICAKCPFAVWCLANGRPPNAAKVCPECLRVWVRRPVNTETYRNRCPQVMWWSFVCPKVKEVVFPDPSKNGMPVAPFVRVHPEVIAGHRMGGCHVIKCPNCINDLKRDGAADRPRVYCGDLEDRDHVWGLRLFLGDNSGLS